MANCWFTKFNTPWSFSLENAKIIKRNEISRLFLVTWFSLISPNILALIILVLENRVDISRLCLINWCKWAPDFFLIISPFFLCFTIKGIYSLTKISSIPGTLHWKLRRILTKKRKKRKENRSYTTKPVCLLAWLPSLLKMAMYCTSTLSCMPSHQ